MGGAARYVRERNVIVGAAVQEGGVVDGISVACSYEAWIRGPGTYAGDEPIVLCGNRQVNDWRGAGPLLRWAGGYPEVGVSEVSCDEGSDVSCFKGELCVPVDLSLREVTGHSTRTSSFRVPHDPPLGRSLTYDDSMPTVTGRRSGGTARGHPVAQAQPA